MTDTGQVLGEGQPEHAGEQAGQPAPASPAGPGAPEQSGAAQSDAYGYPGGPGVVVDDDDLLLMPAAQGAWTEQADRQPRPAAPHPQPARRPLHMGPPVPDATGGVVRSLADRGPAAPPQPMPVRQSGPPTVGPEYLDVPTAGAPQSETAPQQDSQAYAAGPGQAPFAEPGPQPEDPAHPVAYDAPGAAPLPGPQLGEIPPQVTPWDEASAQAVAVPVAPVDGAQPGAHPVAGPQQPGAAQAPQPATAPLSAEAVEPGVPDAPAPGAVPAQAEPSAQDGPAAEGGPAPQQGPEDAAPATVPQDAPQEQPVQEQAAQPEGEAPVVPQNADGVVQPAAAQPEQPVPGAEPQPAEASADVPAAEAAEAGAPGAEVAQDGAGASVPATEAADGTAPVAVGPESAAPEGADGAAPAVADVSEGTSGDASGEPSGEVGAAVPVETVPEGAVAEDAGAQPDQAAPEQQGAGEAEAAPSVPQSGEGQAPVPGEAEAVEGEAPVEAVPAAGAEVTEGAAAGAEGAEAASEAVASEAGDQAEAGGQGQAVEAAVSETAAVETVVAEAAVAETAVPAAGAEDAAQEQVAEVAETGGHAEASAAEGEPEAVAVEGEPGAVAAGAQVTGAGAPADASAQSAAGLPVAHAVVDPAASDAVVPEPSDGAGPQPGADASQNAAQEQLAQEHPEDAAPQPDTPAGPEAVAEAQPETGAATDAEAATDAGPATEPAEATAAAEPGPAPEALVTGPAAPPAQPQMAPVEPVPGPYASGPAVPGGPVPAPLPATATPAAGTPIAGWPQTVPPAAPEAVPHPQDGTGAPQGTPPHGAPEAVAHPEADPARTPAGPERPAAEATAASGGAQADGVENGEANGPEHPAPVSPQGAEAAAEAPGPEATAPAQPPAPGYDESERAAVHRVMRERRDIRNGFRPDPIPNDVLLRVLEAAHTAPSVGHSQPWDFVVIRSAETRERMHQLATDQRKAYAESLPKGRAKQFRELKIEAILDTPVNIVVTADPTRGGRHTLGRHTQPQMAPYSSALAVENLWLAARAEGLGVGWVSFFDERQMVTELGLPEHLEVVAYLCVGYVDEFPEEPELMQAGWAERRPLSWVVHEETYGRRALPGEDPHDLLRETLHGIRPLDAKALGEAWERQKRMTKPAGALGMLEIISAQLCGLSRKCPPPIPEPAAVAIFAGDHGVHAQGVTPWPQEVTGQMVANFLGGGAVCNAFATQVGAEVCVVDVGVATELPAAPGLLPRKVRAGTDDFTAGPAMSQEDVLKAVEAGIETARDLVAAGNKALLTGEMGIANTTASAALISVYTGTDPAEITGRGTGINDETHARKVDVVRRALELHRPDPADPIGVLAAVGGLEHAALVGLILGGASLRTPVILDGVSAGAAALVAHAIAPEALAACIAGHRSAEPGHVAALTKLGLRPLVDLDLRLGEGTGALLALPLVQSAARAMHEVATFDTAGVTEKD
ncbi:nicotinate-nucleotide--dimethylbenzimidazole phosphoribosyltransferase [Streptomyces sp. BBFR2]|uniref:nicotinate-nucleotide--dimethylbenzimidazole phosphoribosyltransferase n=1 Tax=Streptomyces sp. BBFR2 TaxID=3372854 RepID=UPI0037D9BC57